MVGYFESILRMSIGASVSILIICFARLLLRRSPKIISYMLWAVVLWNLVCPLRWELPILPSGERVAFTQMATGQSAVVNTLSGDERKPDNSNVDAAINPAANSEQTLQAKPLQQDRQAQTTPAYVGEVIDNAQRSFITMEILPYIWITGAGMMLIFGSISYLMLKRRVALAVRTQGGVYETDAVDSPFVLGLIKPRIYLPVGLTGTHRDYILAHERTHLRRLDYLVLIVAYLALAAHWFNPLVWLAYFIMRRDMESSCDEAVLRSAHANARRDYATALIAFADTKRRLPVPLAFGEESVKSRVKNVLRYRRVTAAGIVVACLVSLAVIAGCTTTLGEEADESVKQTATDENSKTKAPDESAQMSATDGNLEPTTPETQSPTQSQAISDPDSNDLSQFDGVEILPGVGSEVPELVLQDAVQYVKDRMEAVSTPANGALDGAVVDGARLEQLELVYTYDWTDVTENDRLEGAQIEVYRYEWRYHTTTPDKFILVGGMDMSSDGWLRNTYPNSNYLICRVLDDERYDLGTFFCINDDPGGESFKAILQSALGYGSVISSEYVLGYITDFDVVQRTFLFDEFEWVTDEDEERAKELGLDVDDGMPGGFYIYNAEERWDTYSYDDELFHTVDYSQKVFNLKADEQRFAERVQEFEEYDGSPGLPARLWYSDGKLIEIGEQYVP